MACFGDNYPQASAHTGFTAPMHHMELLREFNKKYLGHPDYDPKAASLGRTFYDNYLLLSASHQ